MFWRKKSAEEMAREKKIKREVKKLEGRLWGYMVNQEGVIVDKLKDWRKVEQHVTEGDRPVGLTMVRIFDPFTAEQKGVTIDEYGSLDNHPDLILYEGSYRQEVGGQATDISINKK